jgi:hypothetical protein
VVDFKKMLISMEGEAYMNMNELKKMAKGLGIKSSNKKAELIHAIQIAEGHFDCFGKAEGYCDQEDGLFRVECLNE